jgi:hypothetical protein
MTPVLIGTALALLALAFVLFPLFRDDLHVARPVAARVPSDRANTAIDALREIEFDHATGKLAEHDYETLKASYTQRAVTAMRDGSGESAVVCGTCGPRPESNAAFCSQCGRELVA